MSFRKRNAVIGAPAASSPAQRKDKAPALGTRPSPLDGRLTTSTGTTSLDQLLAGHAGLPMGSSLLLEETGTTDFGGLVLRYYAAEGLVQGHHVHVLGPSASWRRELPGLKIESKAKPKPPSSDATADSKMKIAWRYETLGNRATPPRDGPQAGAAAAEGVTPFCHGFDLTRRLENNAVRGQLYTLPQGDPTRSLSGQSPFHSFIHDIVSKLEQEGPSSIHRIVVPSLLSPTLYGSSACRPQEVLQFLHSLRGLLRRFPMRLTAMVTLPISLHPRSTGLIRWAELLFDGVLELIPLQHQSHSQMNHGPGSEDKAQGLLRAHSLPVFHEKGGGPEGGWAREDLSFKLSASTGMVITPYSLPPVGEEETAPSSDGHKAAADDSKESLEF